MGHKQLRSTILKWSILTLVVAYTAWVTVWAHGEAANTVCRDIRVDIERTSSADSTTRAGVLHELAGYPGRIIGSPLSDINLQSVENYLGKLSNFENVECNLTADGDLHVSVRPMIPVMRVFDGSNSFYVNRQGKVIPSNPRFFVDVPVVSGKFSRAFSPASLLPVVSFVKNDNFLRNLVGMTVANDPDNIILVPRILGHVINFGDTTRLDEKRDALLLFYRKVIPYKGWQEYDTISVKFNGQIVATRRNKTLASRGPLSVEDDDMEEATLPDAPENAAENTAVKPNDGN